MIDGADAARASRHDTTARLRELAAADARRSTAPPTRCCPCRTAALIAALIPGAQLEILDGVGHLFFWERPERSAELLRAHAAVHA